MKSISKTVSLKGDKDTTPSQSSVTSKILASSIDFQQEKQNIQQKAITQ